MTWRRCMRTATVVVMLVALALGTSGCGAAGGNHDRQSWDNMNGVVTIRVFPAMGQTTTSFSRTTQVYDERGRIQVNIQNKLEYTSDSQTWRAEYQLYPGWRIVFRLSGGQSAEMRFDNLIDQSFNAPPT